MPFLFILAALPAQGASSSLWGKHGERWKPTSRLPDFSFAGYAGGTAPIPEWPVVANVKEFGAVGDGVTNDSAAFAKALASVSQGTLFVPAGRYLLTSILLITKPHVVIRGAGQGQTVLYFPKPLQDAVGPGKEHAPGGSWSWSGGFVSFKGVDEGALFAAVTSPAKRGTFKLQVDKSELFHAGQWVRLVQQNMGGTLARHLYGDLTEPPTGLLKLTLVDFSSRITKVNDHAIVLERPLRTDVQLLWRPALYASAPTVTDVGIEDLSIEFPPVAYSEHHKEPGYNAIDFSGITNGWVRRVTIRNADAGVLLRDGTRFCTIDHVTLTAVPSRVHQGVSGHHGFLALGLTQDNCFTHFVIDERFIHDLAVSSLAAGNVFNHGQAIDLSMDHHRRAPYENLFSDIDGGEGKRFWDSGGDDDEGPHSGVRETFWNLRSKAAVPLPPWAIEANLIGVQTSAPEQKTATGNWVESPTGLLPSDLYEAEIQSNRHPPR